MGSHDFRRCVGVNNNNNNNNNNETARLRLPSELVYVHQLIQYDGWIKKSRDGQEECAHDSGHVFLKCFRFTFQQLRVKKDANMLKVQESRSALTPTKSIHANLNANHNAR